MFAPITVGTGPLALEVATSGAIRPFEHGKALSSAVEFMVMQGAEWRIDTANNRILCFDKYLTDSLRRASDSWATSQGSTLKELGRRFDSGVGAGLGGAEPRDLTFRFPDILNEKLPPLHSFEYFTLDNTVPPGAVEFELYRSYTSGEARDVLLRKADALFWNGSDNFDLWGVLNYPFLDVGVSATAISSSSTPAAIIEAISVAANYAHVESKQAFESNAVVMSTAIYRYLSTTLAGGGDNSTTILEFVQKANPHIKRWLRSYRLDGTGPSSYHGMFFYRDDEMGVNPIITLDPTPLPVQSFGIMDKTYMVMGVGGVVMKEVGNCLIKWFSIA